MSSATESVVRNLLGFFDFGVLAQYRERSHEYEVRTDYFEGHLITRNSGGSAPYADIRFGFRLRRDGTLAVVAYMPDLEKAADEIQRRWEGFRLEDKELADGSDRRFKLWVRRYFEADFDVENGPLERLRETVVSVNALCRVAAGSPLFEAEDAPEAHFPRAENDHACQDAHAKLYGLLIDGLSKPGIQALAKALGQQLNIANDNTLKAMKRILPQSEVVAIVDPLDVVSQQRRLADHKVRPPATSFAASNRFLDDCESVLAAMEGLRDWLSAQFSLKVEDCQEYLRAVGSLPTIDPGRPAQPNYLIWRLTKLKGRKIERVDFGYEVSKPGHHETEAAVLWLDVAQGWGSQRCRTPS